MFDFKNANMEQKSAISHVDGPLLITAGSGTFYFSSKDSISYSRM